MPGFVNNATGKVSRRATRFEERKGGSGPVPHYHYRNLLTPYRQVGLMLQAAPTMLNCSSGGLKKSSTEAKQELTFAPGGQGQLVLQGQPGPHDDGRGVGQVLAVRPARVNTITMADLGSPADPRYAPQHQLRICRLDQPQRAVQPGAEAGDFHPGVALGVVRALH